MNRFLSILVVAALAQASLPAARGDVFGSGASSFEIEFVTVGNPGNPPDANPNPAGAVPYEYRIGKYEVSEEMIAKANALGGLGITTDTRGPDFPATSVTWYEAARFVNWLNTSTGSVPAYKFDAAGNFQLWDDMDLGYNPANLYRNRLAKYFLPSINEWHKAAYYDPVGGVYYDYPTGSDSVPDGIDFAGDPNFDAVFFDDGSNGRPNEITNVGLSSPFGTAAQGGNVDEWQETSVDGKNDGVGDGRGLQGGGWNWPSSVMLASNRNGIAPSFEGEVTFRVASVVPEPNSLVLAVLAPLVLLGFITRRSKREGIRGQND
jgi:formylglycine-generating enzyme required for sulfatase activity